MHLLCVILLLQFYCRKSRYQVLETLRTQRKGLHYSIKFGSVNIQMTDDLYLNKSSGEVHIDTPISEIFAFAFSSLFCVQH